MKIDQFTNASLNTSRDAWRNRACELDIPQLDYEMLFTWAETKIDYENPNHNSFVYGIFEDDGCLLAIVEIIYTKRGNGDVGWLKMMDIKLCPDFSPSEIEENPEKFSKVAAIYKRSINDAIELTGQHPARVVKLFARDNALFKVYATMVEFMHENYKAEMHGRWLVITEI
jgi:hypothetical protein